MFQVGQWIVRNKVGAVAVIALAVVVAAPNHGGTGLFPASAPTAPLAQPEAAVPVVPAVQPQVVEAPVDAPDGFYDDAGGDDMVDDQMAEDPSAEVEPDLVPEGESIEPDLSANPPPA